MYKPLIAKSAMRIYIYGYQAEDLIQIGGIALINAVNKYDCDKNIPFTSYAKKAIQNSFNKELRKVIGKKDNEKFSYSLNSLNKYGVEVIEALESEENVEETAILKEEIALLKVALNSLSPDEKEILDWFYFRQRTLKEYAEVKGLNRTTVVKRKTRAIEKLRKFF
ncbi:sigma-70 family RNA polymerase sigma factor [Clostridium aciditolerans]|uniref:Sigma-70 family RNA polymerase sigma factor n=2 Tax=Clostridium aciditolerans TaxID=339861 RepID=A0A934HVI4_9CLOT|nr:sigma-70 family RNA polymerase sigma factor [Clostridium aciditolerans]